MLKQQMDETKDRFFKFVQRLHNSMHDASAENQQGWIDEMEGIMEVWVDLVPPVEEEKEEQHLKIGDKCGCGTTVKTEKMLEKHLGSKKHTKWLASQ